MRKKPKFQLIQSICKRCGKQVTTGNRSLYNLNELKEKWGNICIACLSKTETNQLENEMFRSVFGYGKPTKETMG